MAVYIPCKGEERDGRCQCGKPAVTEVQCGWHNGEHGKPSGGQYDEVCQECYDELVAWAKEHGPRNHNLLMSR